MQTVPDADYRALAQLRYEIRQFLAFSEQAARTTGLEPQQHQLLLLLRGLPEDLRPNVRTVAERLLIKHNSAVELIARAVDAGLVFREPSPHDGREVLIRVTAEGEAVLERLTVAHRDELRVQGPRLLEALRAIVEAP